MRYNRPNRKIVSIGAVFKQFAPWNALIMYEQVLFCSFLVGRSSIRNILYGDTRSGFLTVIALPYIVILGFYLCGHKLLVPFAAQLILAVKGGASLP